MKFLYKQYSVLLLLLSMLSFEQMQSQEVDEAYARLIEEYTTDARFLPKSMHTFPASALLPSPLKHFGTIIGAPGVMHHTADIYNYYNVLASNLIG